MVLGYQKFYRVVRKSSMDALGVIDIELKDLIYSK